MVKYYQTQVFSLVKPLSAMVKANETVAQVLEQSSLNGYGKREAYLKLITAQRYQIAM